MSGALLQLQRRRCGRLCRDWSFQSVGAHAYAATRMEIVTYRTLFLFPYAATRRCEVVQSHIYSPNCYSPARVHGPPKTATSNPQRQRRNSVVHGKPIACSRGTTFRLFLAFCPSKWFCDRERSNGGPGLLQVLHCTLGRPETLQSKRVRD